MKILFPDEVIYETPNFKIAQDWEVPISAFFILSTKRKINSVEDFSDEEAREFGVLLKMVRQGMTKVLGCKEVYLFQNEDSIHGFHLWILPRHEWMEKFGRKVQSVRPILDHASKSLLQKT